MSEERLNSVGLFRRQPYRPLFCVGFALAWIGVFHWLAFAMGWTLAYRREFHALVQIQGVITSFAIGFLFTMIPRRTQTEPPSVLHLALAITAPMGVAVAAWGGGIALGQGVWIVLILSLIFFAVRRFKSGSGGRRPPNAFVWIPMSFLTGLAGAALVAGFDLGWYRDTRLYLVGWLALTQVMFLGLILGVGTMLLPLITRKQQSIDGGSSGWDRRERGLHLIGWLCLLASCYVEAAGMQGAGFAIRFTVVLAILVFGIRLHRPPTVPGLHRRLVWIAGWSIPLGYLIGLVLPGQPQVGLHVVFIAGFALMAFSVALHVALAHGGAEDLVFKTTPPVAVFATLFLLTVVFRTLVVLDSGRTQTWLGLAAGSFLLGSLAWAWLAVPRLLGTGGSIGDSPSRS